MKYLWGEAGAVTEIWKLESAKAEKEKEKRARVRSKHEKEMVPVKLTEWLR